MKPIRDLVLIKPCPSDEFTEGGLFVPETARERSAKAEVVSVGRGTKAIKMETKIGDVVFHVKNAGEEIIIDGVPHYIIRQQDILSYTSNN